MFRFIFILNICLFSFSCNDTGKKTTANKVEKPAAQKPAPTTIKVQGKKLYPSVPVETIQSIANKCDYVDIGFENLPISINRKEPSDIIHTLRQIAGEPALINDACPLLGTIIFYRDGDIALEGEIYFSEGCNYFVFLENNKPKYANFMTASGITFFKDIISKFGGKQ